MKVLVLPVLWSVFPVKKHQDLGSVLLRASVSPCISHNRCRGAGEQHRGDTWAVPPSFSRSWSSLAWPACRSHSHVRPTEEP